MKVRGDGMLGFFIRRLTQIKTAAEQPGSVMKSFLICFAVILFISSGIANAAIINVPADYPTIQEAIDAASNGDIIKVSSGTYGAFNTKGKKLNIKGTNGPEYTELDACIDFILSKLSVMVKFRYG